MGFSHLNDSIEEKRPLEKIIEKNKVSKRIPKEAYMNPRKTLKFPINLTQVMKRRKLKTTLT